MTFDANADSQTRSLRDGIGGPVDLDKPALVEALCKRLRDTHDIYVITNEIQRKEIRDD
jgi:urease accessory protein